MRYFNFILLLFALTIFADNSLYSQIGTYRIKGALIDSIRNENVEFATVAIIKKGEEQPVKYALSNAEGKFELAGVPKGSYKLKIEFMGYTTVEKNLELDSQRSVDLGNINMIEQLNMLDQVVVSAVGNPVVIKKDTIEYNASSFMTTDSDALEALLKKLPGIEIDADGKITANGKAINKIMVDGKSYFLNDPTIATKNLPANIVDKVKVVNRKSEQARFTGIDDGNEETVIDLSIKPGMMNGWFGNATAGYGTLDRYQGAGMISNFKKTSMISIVLNANNTNNRSFTDMAGGMMGGMRGGGGFGGGGRIRVGGSVFNIGGSGITSSWMAGVNANKEFFDGKLKLGGSYNYGSSETLSEGKRERQTFLPDSTFTNNDISYSKNSTENHRVGLELEWAPSETTSFLFRPNISVGLGSFLDSTKFDAYGLSGKMINDGKTRSAGDNNSFTLDGDLLYRQRLGKPGRTFSINMNYSVSNNETNGLNESQTTIFGIKDTTEIIKQKYNQSSLSYSLTGRASYTEPLGRNFFMELAYRYSYRVNESDKEAYNYNVATGKFDNYDTEYSNDFNNTFINQQAEINVRKNEERYSYSFGFNVQPSYTESIGGTRDIQRTIVNYSPTAMYDYRISEMSNIRVSYRGNTNQPTIDQLQPVPDNTNPLYVKIGNPDLLPEFNNSISLEYGKTNREIFRTVRTWLNGNYTMNKIINQSTYKEGGKQEVKPVNENGVWSISNNIMVTSPIKKSNFSFSNNLRFSLNKGISYTSMRGSSESIRNRSTSLSLSDFLRFTYRDDRMEISINGNATYNYAWYTIKENMKPATWNNTIGSRLTLNLPLDLNIGSDYNYMFYVGYGKGYNEPAHVWNADISKQLLKKMATLKLSVYDILNQSKNTFRNMGDNYIEDTQNNTLTRYLMLSFTIRFGSFGSGPQRGGFGMMRGGWGGGHGGGMPRRF